MSHALTDVRRAYRDPEDRFLAGVASGVAAHLGVDAFVVRVALLIMVLWGGFGLVLYAVLWALLPVRDPMRIDESVAPGLAAATRRGSRQARQVRGRDMGVLVSFGLVGLGALVLLQNAGWWLSPRLFWPLLVASAGLALLWWQTDESRRSEWLTTSSGWKSWVRVLLGVGLLVVALSLTLLQAGVSDAVDDVLVVILLAVFGVALVLGPWLLRVRRDLRVERAERIRSQERADVAAHLHDSVLQTLALIQRQSHDAQVVTQLARTQERELRSWLFDTSERGGGTLKSALEQAITEVESAIQKPIELVVVGDRELDDATMALAAATREAMVNAAKHSGADRVDVYVEVGNDVTEVFVRDRGAGFDPSDIPEDRLGVRRSIIDRMDRHGGASDVKSRPGEGTEVRLTMPNFTTKQENT